MKKSAKKPVRKPRKSKASAQATTESTGFDRRKLLTYGIGTLGLGAAGWFGVSAVQATAREQDLSRVGQGKPTIVQIHDPTCPMCTQLQRETRKALKCFGECDLVYLVANVRGDEGRAFAARYNSPHVTLLLFDGAGELQNTIRGVQDSTDLKARFEALSV